VWLQSYIQNSKDAAEATAKVEEPVERAQTARWAMA